MNTMTEDFKKITVSEAKNFDTGTSLKSLSQSQNSKRQFIAEKVVGNGTFGVVYMAVDPDTQEKLAIKKVFQDPKYKNRELAIIKELNHPNCVKLKQAFYTKEQKENNEEIYLNIVMDYVPETLYKVLKHFRKQKDPFPQSLCKLYTYQMFRSLAYIHGLGICHRDIKPQNLLVDPEKNLLKLCDFGSAKRLVKGETSISYICSRYYRAPELIFGATEYNCLIDVWSAGCVMAELMLGQPIFPGDSAVDQLVEIIKILGSPDKESIYEMNPHHDNEFKIPNIKPYPWTKVFKNKGDPLAIDFLTKILVYSPKKRFGPLQALTHSYFDDLREENFKINDKKIHNLFNFTKEELSLQPELETQLIPSWYRAQQKSISLAKQMDSL